MNRDVYSTNKNQHIGRRGSILYLSLSFLGENRRQSTIEDSPYSGQEFSLPREQRPQLCARIECILAGQMTLALPSDTTIETLAQRYAAQLVVAA